MDKMNGSSLGKQCQNPLPPPCPLPPPHLISTAYKDILWSSYLLVLNYMQATSAQAGQLSVKFFEIVHSIHCTTQNTRYWNLNSSMNVVSETDKTNQLSSLSHCHFIDASLISQCTWHRLTCLARWIGRGSRIMRSNAIGIFLLEDRNVINDVPAWHPPSPLLHDPHHAINSFCYEQPELFTTVRFTTNNITVCIGGTPPSSQLALFSFHSCFSFFASVISHKHLGKSISTSTRNVRPWGVERYVKNALIKFFTVGCNFLNTCFVVQIPQANATVMTCNNKN